MTTIKKIAEEVLRMLRGNPVISARVHINDAKLLIQQVANQLLKADHFSVNMPAGETVPNNCMIFSYDAVPVQVYKTTKSKSKLPSIPISLPRNMGVLHISTTTAIDEPFVPIPTSMYGIVKPQDMLGDLSGLIGYEVVGSDVIYTKNLVGMGISTVYMRLVGVDISTLTDYDILPLSADMEAQVVQTVYNMLVQAPPAEMAQTIRDK